jgi:hypothetical protein
MAKWFFVLALALVATSCGDNVKGSPQPAELTPDPSVEEGCTTAAPAPGAVRAKFLACDAEKVAGLLAAGRTGDVLLENNLVRIIIRGPGEGFRLHGTSGGGIVDAALHGREDQLLEIQPMLDWGVGSFDEMVITSSGLENASEPGVAELVIRGSLVSVPLVASVISVDPPELIMEQRYRLRPDARDAEITTRAYSKSDSSLEVTGLRDVAFFGGALHPFVPGMGFGGSAAVNGRFLASEGGESSYGFIFPERPNSPLNVFELNGLFLLQAIDLETDEPAERRHFIVGDGSTSSVADVAYQLAHEISVSSIGGTAPSGFTIAVHDSDGRAITRTRASEEGSFTAIVPVDSGYTVQSVQEGTLPGPEVSATVSDAPVDDLLVAAGAGGSLSVSVRDEDANDLPARVMLTSDAGQQVVHIAAPTTIPLPPGDYSISVSRGMEYALFEQPVLTIADAEVQTLDVVLEREVDTDGWIAVDTHLHSEMSTDSSVPLDQRLLSVAGEGVEVAISTDHDFVTDYAPYVDRLGLGSFLATQLGAEVSSTVVGHINGWPLEAKLDEASAGSPPWYGQSPGQVAKLIRDGHSDRIVQINHPRRGSDATFDDIELDRDTLTSLADPEELGLSGADLNDFDFDAIEVANAKADESFDESFGDWLAFLKSGQRKTATGSSDSHSTTAYSGKSRTYVQVGTGQDVPGQIDLGDLNQALREGKAMVSQGAFVTILAEDGEGLLYGPGERSASGPFRPSPGSVMAAGDEASDLRTRPDRLRARPRPAREPAPAIRSGDQSAPERKQRHLLPGAGGVSRQCGAGPEEPWTILHQPGVRGPGW